MIVPAVIHNGPEFPKSLDDIQRFEMTSCFNVRMADNSRRAEELDNILENQAPALAKAIESAPRWRKAWPKKASQEFYREWSQGKAPSQRRLPRFTPQ